MTSQFSLSNTFCTYTFQNVKKRFQTNVQTHHTQVVKHCTPKSLYKDQLIKSEQLLYKSSTIIPVLALPLLICQNTKKLPCHVNQNPFCSSSSLLIYFLPNLRPHTCQFRLICLHSLLWDKIFVINITDKQGPKLSGLFTQHMNFHLQLVGHGHLARWESNGQNKDSSKYKPNI